MSGKERRIEAIRLWLLLGLAAIGVALQAAAWPQSFHDRLARLDRDGLVASAMKRSLQPLSRDRGGIFLENPNDFFYYYTVYYAYPRPVHITDGAPLINRDEDILAAASRLTEKTKQKLDITCLVRPEGDRIAVFKLE